MFITDNIGIDDEHSSEWLDRCLSELDGETLEQIKSTPVNDVDEFSEIPENIDN